MQSLYELLKASKGLPVSDSYAALWAKKAESGIKTLTGKLPLFFQTSENKLRDWVIYGNNQPGKNLLDLGEYDSTAYGLRAFAEDGQLRIVGKYNDTSAHTPFRFYTYLEEGDYILSGSPNYTDTGYAIQAGTVTDSSGAGFVQFGFDRGNGLTFTLESASCVAIRIYTGAAAYYIDVDFTMPIMLRKADTSSVFEPYQIGVGERTKNIFKIIPSEQIITETGTLGFTVDAFVGTIAATGTSGTEASVKQRFTVSSETAGNYYFSADFNLVGSTGTFDAYLYDLTAHRFITKWDGTTRAPTIIGTESQEVLLIEGHIVEITLRIYKETTVDELIFKPMLRPANTTSDFTPYGYQIPLDVRDGKTGEYNYAYDIFIGESPLTEGQSVSKASTGIDIRTIADQENYPNILTTALTNKPEAMIKYKE